MGELAPTKKVWIFVESNPVHGESRGGKSTKGGDWTHHVYASEDPAEQGIATARSEREDSFLDTCTAQMPADCRALWFVFRFWENSVEQDWAFPPEQGDKAKRLHRKLARELLAEIKSGEALGSCDDEKSRPVLVIDPVSRTFEVAGIYDRTENNVIDSGYRSTRYCIAFVPILPKGSKGAAAARGAGSRGSFDSDDDDDDDDE